MPQYSEWIWSPDHHNYYCWIRDSNGNVEYIWGPKTAPDPEPTQVSQSVLRIQQPRTEGFPVQSSTIHSQHRTDSVPTTISTLPTSYQQNYSSSSFPYLHRAHFSHATNETHTQYPNQSLDLPSYDFPGYGAGSGGSHEPNLQWFHPLDRRYERVRNPRAYFKKGRVFMTLVTEMQKFNDLDETVTYRESVFAKIGRFIVIRPKAKHCLCLPIQTYSGRATSKPGVNPDDHAALVEDGREVQYVRGERPLRKEPLKLILENEGADVSPMSRVNFGKVTTVENNVMVRTIGRIHPASLQNLEHYFLESLGINNAPQQYWSDESAQSTTDATPDGQEQASQQHWQGDSAHSLTNANVDSAYI